MVLPIRASSVSPLSEDFVPRCLWTKFTMIHLDPCVYYPPKKNRLKSVPSLSFPHTRIQQPPATPSQGHIHTLSYTFVKNKKYIKNNTYLRTIQRNSQKMFLWPHLLHLLLFQLLLCQHFQRLSLLFRIQLIKCLAHVGGKIIWCDYG